MKRFALAICTLLAIVVTTACSSSSNEDDSDECCPISDAPVCGGTVYDAAPGVKSTDAKGCPVWSVGPACGASH